MDLGAKRVRIRTSIFQLSAEKNRNISLLRVTPLESRFISTAVPKISTEAELNEFRLCTTAAGHDTEAEPTKELRLNLTSCGCGESSQLHELNPLDVVSALTQVPPKLTQLYDTRP